MSRRFDTLIFDLDGTLADTFPDVVISVNVGRAAMDRPPVPDAEVRRAIGPGRQVFLDTLMPSASGVEQQAFLDAFRAHYETHCLDTTQLYPGMETVLESVKDLRLAVATNKPGPTARKILEGLGVLGHFQRLLGPGEVRHPKPHPEMVVRALMELGSEPETALFIGDTVLDIQAGQAAGVAVAAAGWGYGHPEEIKSHRPDFILEKPVDIHHTLHINC